jgi:galactoside O-acetyltransferase
MTENVKKINPFYKGFYLSDELREMGFKSIGQNVKVAKNCTIVGLENIELESNVQIDENVFISSDNGSLKIGKYVHIGGGSHLNCSSGIYISDFCGLSQGVKIYSISDDYSGEYMTNTTIPKKYKNIQKGPVYLHKHVIVGASSVILPGVTIGEGASIGALSLVNTSIKEWGIYFGLPVKKIKNRSKKLLDLEKYLIESL